MPKYIVTARRYASYDETLNTRLVIEADSVEQAEGIAEQLHYDGELIWSESGGNVLSAEATWHSVEVPETTPVTVTDDGELIGE